MKTARSSRQAMMARVHIAWKEMGIGEDAYRDVLRRITGKASAKDCGEGQLAMVLDEFRRLGWTPKSAKKPSANTQVRIIYAIWGDVARALAGDAGKPELRAFCKRMTGVDAPEFCDPQQCNVVIEGLKGWRANLRKKMPAPGCTPPVTA